VWCGSEDCSPLGAPTFATMMDAIVQFIRNGLCILKDLDLFRDTFLYDPSVTAHYYDFPEPLNKTTPLEVFIAVAQLYVVVTTPREGLSLMAASYGKLSRIHRLMQTYGGGEKKVANDDTDRLINASLIKEATFALRSIFVGFNVFFIGLSFIWLFANSLHITETDWIGGLPALIHSLTVMNVCLVPLLYYMYKDGNEQLAKAAKLENVLNSKVRKGTLQPADMTLSILEAVSSVSMGQMWLPFWDTGVGLFETLTVKVDLDKEAKMMAAEKTKVKQIVDSVCSDKKNKEEQEDLVEHLEATIRVTRLEGYREFLYFVVNFVAWYGYGMCIFAYYWPDELKHPSWLRYSMFHMTSADADWRGNFAGDFMWTLEPAIILTSPFYLNSVRTSKKRKKVKAE
jgi:hypothetical protein